MFHGNMLDVTRRPTTNAIMGLTFANYLLQPFYGTCEVPDDAKRLIAAISISKLNYKLARLAEM